MKKTPHSVAPHQSFVRQAEWQLIRGSGRVTCPFIIFHSSHRSFANRDRRTERRSEIDSRDSTGLPVSGRLLSCPILCYIMLQRQEAFFRDKQELELTQTPWHPTNRITVKRLYPESHPGGLAGCDDGEGLPLEQ